MHYRLIQPTSKQPDPNSRLLISPTKEEVITTWNSLQDGNPVAFDLETTGLNCFTDKIVCIGFATSKGSACIDTRDPEILATMVGLLIQTKSFAYNSTFDFSFIEVEARRQFGAPTIGLLSKVFGDAQVMFKLLANEGFTGQSWRLDIAIKHILRWPESNKDTLDVLLKKYGLSKNTMSELMNHEPEAFMQYCADDAVAAYQLMTHLRGEVRRNSWDNVLFVHDKLFANLISLSIEQKLRGIVVDFPAANKLKEDLEKELEDVKRKFLVHPKIAPLMDKFYSMSDREWTEPVTKLRKVPAKKSDQPWEEYVKESEIDLTNPPVETWIAHTRKKKLSKWEEEWGLTWYQYKEVTTQPKKPTEFNLNSSDHLRWLFYKQGLVDYEVVKAPNPEARMLDDRLGVVEIVVEHEGKIHRAPLNLTPGGDLPADKAAATFWGEPGKLIKKHSATQTLLQYTNSLLGVSLLGGDGIYRWHPELRIHGTVTTRSSGAKSSLTKESLSPQILPKDKRFLKCFGAMGGNNLVHLDFASLEPTILAELSGDPTLLEIYASGKPHDLYLWFAAQDNKEIASVYKPSAVTKESRDAAKKAFPTERTISKVAFLSDSYGSGVEAKRRSVMQNMIFLSHREMEAVHNNIHKQLAVSKEFGKGLQQEWEDNGGFLISPMGLPLAVSYTRKKDCASRVIQGSGHIIMMLFAYYTSKLRIERGDTSHPWICDLHDAQIWESQNPEATKKIFEDALQLTNDWLGGKIPMKGDVDIGTTFVDFKD